MKNTIKEKQQSNFIASTPCEFVELFPSLADSPVWVKFRKYSKLRRYFGVPQHPIGGLAGFLDATNERFVSIKRSPTGHRASIPWHAIELIRTMPWGQCKASEVVFSRGYLA